MKTGTDMSEAVELKPIKNGSVVDMVMDRITDAIIAGQYKPGDKIPTEEKLSAALGVARNPCARR
jgi:DNA-binding FadR family transcriptional regulator